MSSIPNDFQVDFIGIGAEKAGTSWVARCLSQHPEIYIPEKKEVFFFNEYDPHYLKYRNRKYHRGLKWYAKQFPESERGKFLGEFTSTYFCCDQAPARIKKHFPEAKLIFVIRDPVERALSQYFHEIRLGLVRKWSLEEAIKKNPSYIYKGFYSQFWEKYRQYFPSQNIKVILFDDIKKDPVGVLKDLYAFLGVRDREFLPSDFNKKVNPQRVSGSLFLNSLMIHSEYLLMRLQMDKVLQLLEDSGFRSLALKIRDIKPSRAPRKAATEKASRPEIKEDTKRRIYYNYREEIPKLESMLGRDLSDWKKYDKDR